MARFLMVAACLALCGCIQKSDSRTFYLYDDGKVDALLLMDNIHSTENDRSKARAEESKWLADFRARSTPELKQIREHHPRHFSARMIREQAPYAAIAQASFDTISDFGGLFDLSPDDPTGRIAFSKDGRKRALSFRIESKSRPQLRPEPSPGASPGLSGEEKLLVWRFVPVGGRLTETKACVPSEDKSSCILDIGDIERQDRANGVIEITIAWELAP